MLLRKDLSSLSEYFGSEADRHRRKARIWFGLAVVFGLGAAYALFNLFRYLNAILLDPVGHE